MMNSNEYSTELALALNGYRALMVPALDQEHYQEWQSLWAHRIPRASKIRLIDSQTADWVKWRNSIIASLISIDEPVVLIAEGFGALAAVSVAAEYPGKVIAVFLVDPADPDQFDLRKKLPKKALSMPTKWVIRKPNNEVGLTKNAALAKLLGADFLSLEEANTSYCSPTDHWPEGIQALKFAVNKVERKAEEITQARTKKILAYLRTMKQVHASKTLDFQPS
jgi:predicted alpha/beta hydrolase family esterase